MTIEQTIEIPANRRLTINVPPQIPTGEARIIIQFPVSDNTKKPVFGCAKGQFWMAEDFNAPLDDFKDYM